MITNRDQELIVAMVGPVFDQGYPSDLLDEYKIRLSMLARAGSIAGLGPMGVMQLLRDFDVKPPAPTTTKSIDDWGQVAVDTPIAHRGQTGLFKGKCGPGTLYVRLDGFQANHEVAEMDVTVRMPRVQGVDDTAFEKEELSPVEKIAQEDVSIEDVDEEDGPTEADHLFAKWETVDAGSKVTVDLGDGEETEAEFFDVENGKVVVLIGEKQHQLDSDNVRLLVEA